MNKFLLIPGVIVSMLIGVEAAAADSWKPDKSPDSHLDGTTVGFYKRLKAPVEKCKAMVEEGAGLGLKDGKVLIDNSSWYGQSYMDGSIKLGCFKIHGALTQMTLTLPTGHELVKKLEIVD